MQNFRSRKLLAGVFSLIVLYFASVQANSKFSRSTISLDDRAGADGIIPLLSKLSLNPLGNQQGGGINLIQSAVNTGIPTLIIGFSLFLLLPLLALKKFEFSPIFLVTFISVLIIQPPLLPIWTATLGLHLGALVRRDSQVKIN